MADGLDSADSPKETGHPAAPLNTSSNGQAHKPTGASPETWTIHQLKRTVNRTATAWRPFPIDAMPDPLSKFAQNAAEAIGCDPSYVALPLLAVTASAIGNSRVIHLKRGWTEPSVIWAVTVGDSGTQKSPALDAVLQHVHRLQAAALRRYQQALEVYEQELLGYERALSTWRRKKDGGEAPEKPKPPVCHRYLCSDVTVEALAPLLQDNPRGVLLARDELAGWVGGFDAYKASGRKTDAAHWLSMHRAGTLIVDRKTGPQRTVHVPRAAVSVTGTIQPVTLRNALGREHFEDGMAARLLLAMPPRRRKRWTEAEVDYDLQSQVEAVLDQLFQLEPDTDDDGNLVPRSVVLTPSGKEAWLSFFDDWAEQLYELTGDLAAAWSKLEGYAARLALVTHCVRCVTGDCVNMDQVDAQSVAAAAQLVHWFGNENRRIYAVLSETEEDRDRRRLMEFIVSRGGTVTSRDLMRGGPCFETADEADAAMQELRRRGYGRLVTVAHNGKGRPSIKFTLDTDTDKNP